MRDADDGDPGFLTELGRFDRSFFVRMIGSFLGLLVVVAIVELGIRFGAQLYRYHQEGPAEVETAAEQLAADIRSIMINEGGPVASRAVYPILDRTYERAGLQIAVEPSPATVESIQEVFGFRPRGIPAVFPEGTHQQARVHLRAESFCLQCHVTASEGDVLGTVVVRDYLSASLSGWWDQVRLSATVSAAKIIIHVTILFFLLKTLMEPLLALRGAVARLADGSGGLRTRAEVRSSDEFGELAHDLNAFLDRITGLLQELRRVLGRMVRVGDAAAAAGREARDRLRQTQDTLDAILPWDDDGEEDLQRRLRRLPRLVDEIHELRHAVEENDALTDELCAVVETGQRLLHRVDVPESADDPDPDGSMA